MGSDRSCTRNRLMPVEVRLPVGRRGHTQAVQRSAPPRQCSPPRNGFLPEASVGHSARSVAPVQTCAPRLTDSATGVALWRKRNPSRRFAHDSPLCRTSAAAVSSPQRCHCTRCPNGTSRAPADSTPPFPVSAAPAQRSPFIHRFLSHSHVPTSSSGAAAERSRGDTRHHSRRRTPTRGRTAPARH